jgi:hypothetical protein
LDGIFLKINHHLSINANSPYCFRKLLLLETASRIGATPILLVIFMEEKLNAGSDLFALEGRSVHIFVPFLLSLSWLQIFFL